MKILDRKRQYAAYFVLSLLAVSFTLAVFYFSETNFGKILGEFNPVVVICVSSVVGFIALWALQRNYGFVIFKGWETLRGCGVSVVFATVLGVIIVIADLILKYPQNINIQPPAAFFFYPAIGFVAEIAFHVVPLTLLLFVLKPLSDRLGQKRIVWLCILLVSSIEPTYHVLFTGYYFTWMNVYTWIHIFVISLLQLYVFWKYDFVSMYLFRIFYYIYWHIVWGVIRLDVLF
ncbi:MAG: hypothetical protein OEW99_00805 [Gammaproteobacteria bacterium]|nr:hypothetical protein [Gammaproteobacteria bacterium]